MLRIYEDGLGTNHNQYMSSNLFLSGFQLFVDFFQYKKNTIVWKKRICSQWLYENPIPRVGRQLSTKCASSLRDLGQPKQCRLHMILGRSQIIFHLSLNFFSYFHFSLSFHTFFFFYFFFMLIFYLLFRLSSLFLLSFIFSVFVLFFYLLFCKFP